MNLKNTSVYLLAAWMLAACAGSGLQKTENGVIIEVSRQRPADVRKVRLEVMGEKLIRVSATPEKEFSKEPDGLFARIIGKISALTILQYINYKNEKPIGRVKYALF